MRRAGLLFTVCLTVTVLLPSMMIAQPKLATNGFVFLEIPATARQASMGEAYAALDVSDATAVFINPASLAYVPSVSFSGTYGDWFLDTNHQTASAAMRLRNYGVVGLSLIRMDLGEFHNTVLTDDPAFEGFQEVGTFDASAYAIGVSYAYQMTDRFAFGGTVRYVKESTGTFQHEDPDITKGEASNFLMELGTMYYTGFRSLRLATTAQNFGFNTEYFGDAFQPPIVYRMSMAMDFFDAPGSPAKLTTIVEAVHPTDLDEKIHIGSELMIRNLLTIRGGYKFQYDEESYSFGAGLKLSLAQNQNISIDYSYSDFGVFDNISRISVIASL